MVFFLYLKSIFSTTLKIRDALSNFYLNTILQRCRGGCGT
jgi:hypothetical protein